MTKHCIRFACILLCVYVLFNKSANAVTPKTDFNGDGFADVFLQNSFTGDLAVWLLDYNQVIQTSAIGKIKPQTGWMPIEMKDFNGDGRTDIFFRNVNSGELYIWLMNGSRILHAASVGKIAPSTGWLPLYIKDINRDGSGDVLFRNSNTGELYVWFMNGSQVLQYESMGSINPSTGWIPLSMNDLNGDGSFDIIWRNTNSGELYVWLMASSQVLLKASLGTVAPRTGWLPMDIKDVNGDGRSDIVWRNVNSGELYVWLLDGLYILQMASLGTVAPATGWVPLNMDDFNGDGRSDIIWNNANRGELYVWLLDGSYILQKASLGSVNPNTGWMLRGMDDFNGDGRTDIFWRNAFDNETVAWVMDGASILYTQSYSKAPSNSVWQIQIPNR